MQGYNNDFRTTAPCRRPVRSDAIESQEKVATTKKRSAPPLEPSSAASRMGRTPCRDVNSSSPRSSSAKSAKAVVIGDDDEATALFLPPCLEGSRSLEFVATKKAAVPGKNGGSWSICANVKVGRKTVFERKSSLVFGLSDDVEDRDAECLGQLKKELAEVWHRMTCSPKSTCRFLSPGHEFRGSRQVSLHAKKSKKGKKILWTCKAAARTDHAGFSRNTKCDYVAETDASRSSAAALHLEIGAVWHNATRGENETYDHEFAERPIRSQQQPVPKENQEPSGGRRGAMRFIRDVYGASSNVEAVVNAAPHRS